MVEALIDISYQKPFVTLVLYFRNGTVISHRRKNKPQASESLEPLTGLLRAQTPEKILQMLNIINKVNLCLDCGPLIPDIVQNHQILPLTYTAALLQKLFHN